MIRSPRLTRQDTIAVKNKIGETNGNADWQETTIQYTRVNVSYGVEQSKAGIQADGSAMIVIDLNDLVAKRQYTEPLEFEKLESLEQFFTLRPDVDCILYRGHDYTIVSVHGISHNGKLAFLEVTANE